MVFSDDITDYFTNYKLVPSTFANAGDTGLTTGNCYLCFRIDDLDHITEAQAAESGGSSTFRQMVISLVKAMYDAIQAIAAADRPTKLVIYLNNTNSGDADLKLTMNVQADVDLTDMDVVSE
jgi:hypothetical protein